MSRQFYRCLYRGNTLLLMSLFWILYTWTIFILLPKMKDDNENRVRNLLVHDKLGPTNEDQQGGFQVSSKTRENSRNVSIVGAVDLSNGEGKDGVEMVNRSHTNRNEDGRLVQKLGKRHNVSPGPEKDEVDNNDVNVLDGNDSEDDNNDVNAIHDNDDGDDENREADDSPDPKDDDENQNEINLKNGDSSASDKEENHKGDNGQDTKITEDQQNELQSKKKHQLLPPQLVQAVPNTTSSRTNLQKQDSKVLHQIQNKHQVERQQGQGQILKSENHERGQHEHSEGQQQGQRQQNQGRQQQVQGQQPIQGQRGQGQQPQVEGHQGGEGQQQQVTAEEERHKQQQAEIDKQNKRQVGGVSVTSHVGQKVVYPRYVETAQADGPGEGGKGVAWQRAMLQTDQQKTEWDEGFRHNSFNQFISDRVSVHRTVHDNRLPECKRARYPDPLPPCTVVIIFHNEAWSVLLRSVHSLLTNTPPHLLDSIILVDDKSTMEHIGKPLDNYFRAYPKVRILRATTRGGLTRARLMGFKASTSDIVVFLDSHIECMTGWYQPLVAPIVKDERTVTFPTIDNIDSKNLAYHYRNGNEVGGLSIVSLTFIWFTRDRKSDGTAPVPSPTMPGGLFAISRRWFEKLGTYDPELLYWGGENIELSFKAWQCGGSVVAVPCSHVGHIFRSTNPIRWSGAGSVLSRNSRRVADVWMDRYKQYYVEAVGKAHQEEDIGDVAPRKAIRERLQCRDFGWYVNNVYPELKEQIDNTAPYGGEIRSQAAPLCVDSMGKEKKPIAYPCHGQGDNQFWLLTAKGNLKQKDTYLVYHDGKISIRWSSYHSPEWEYKTDGRLLHVPTGQCLQASTDRRTLSLLPCTPSSSPSLWQRWILQPRSASLLLPF